LPKKYIQFVPKDLQIDRSIIEFIKTRFTRIEFVGVVSLLGNGLLKANAAQLQKIVNKTRYSNGLKNER